MKENRLWGPILAIAALAVFCAAGAFALRSVASFSSASENPMVILDAGHGGEDGGAVGITGVTESGINLSIVRRADEIFGFMGQETVLTREGEDAVYDGSAQTLHQKKVSDLNNRIALINSYPNATLISIHQNQYPSASCHGAQVFYGTPVLSQDFAKCLQENLDGKLGERNDRLAKQIPDTIYLMSHISCRAVLVECGFLSNPREEQLLQEDDYQLKLALIISGTYLETAGGEGEDAP